MARIYQNVDGTFKLLTSSIDTSEDELKWNTYLDKIPEDTTQLLEELHDGAIIVTSEGSSGSNDNNNNDNGNVDSGDNPSGGNTGGSSSGNNGSNGDYSYTTEERIVGKWLDERDIYEVTFFKELCTQAGVSASGSTYYTRDTFTLNTNKPVDILVKAECSVMYVANNTVGAVETFRILPYLEWGNGSYNAGYNITNSYNNSTKQFIKTSISTEFNKPDAASFYKNLKMTFQYVLKD